MSFELLPPPGVTEGFNDLETLARRKTPQVVNTLDRVIGQQDPAFPEAYQLSGSPEIYAGHLATLLTTHIDSESRVDNTPLIHDSVKLGALLGQHLLQPRFFVVSMKPIVEEYQDNLEGLIVFVLHGPGAYLEDRPALSELVNRYKETVSLDRDHTGMVAHVATLTLLHIDMHQFELYLENRLRKVDEELHAWQAGFSKDE